MATLANNLEENYIKERAVAYKNRGYSVYIEPDISILPDFLKEFRPDLIAKNEQENVVIEVKTRQYYKVNPYITKLDEAIKAHPGWRFELVLLSDEPKPSPEADPQILLKEVEILQKNGNNDAALLLAWSAIEIGLRKIANQENLEITKKAPNNLIKGLATLGFLEKDDYDFLLSALSVRNDVAHGYRPSEDPASYLNKLLKILRNLI